MADEKHIADWNRLHAAGEALGSQPGATKAGDTAIKTLRAAIVSLQMAVLKSSEKTEDEATDQEPS